MFNCSGNDLQSHGVIASRPAFSVTTLLRLLVDTGYIDHHTGVVYHATGHPYPRHTACGERRFAGLVLDCVQFSTTGLLE